MKLMRSLGVTLRMFGVVMLTLATMGATEARAGCDDEGDLWDRKVTKERFVTSYDPYTAEMEYSCYVCVVPGNGWSFVFGETLDASGDEDLLPSKAEWEFWNCQL